MKTRRRVAQTCLLLLLTAVPSGFARSKHGDQPSTDFSTTSRLVLLDVSVKNASGGFASGLKKDDFLVFEDGKPQQITQFADADMPVTIGILVDESSSMRSKRPEVITAALGFVTSSNPLDELFILNFNEQIRRGLPDTVLFTGETPLLRTALLSGFPEGRTRLYDAIAAGLHQLEMGRKDKKALVVISDGGDNASKNTLKDVSEMMLESVATVYTIGVYDEDDPDKNPSVLKHMAHMSGGECYLLSKLEEIVPTCRKIAKDIRTRYTLGYIPNVEVGPRIRHIKVKAVAPDGARLIARTRTSYVTQPEKAAAGTPGK